MMHACWFLVVSYAIGAKIASIRRGGDIVPVPLRIPILERSILEDSDPACLGREVMSFLASNFARVTIGAVFVIDQKSVLAHLYVLS